MKFHNGETTFCGCVILFFVKLSKPKVPQPGNKLSRDSDFDVLSQAFAKSFFRVGNITLRTNLMFVILSFPRGEIKVSNFCANKKSESQKNVRSPMFPWFVFTFPLTFKKCPKCKTWESAKLYYKNPPDCEIIGFCSPEGM